MVCESERQKLLVSMCCGDVSSGVGPVAGGELTPNRAKKLR